MILFIGLILYGLITLNDGLNKELARQRKAGLRK